MNIYVQNIRDISLMNKYTNWYCNIITNAIHRNLHSRSKAVATIGYVELHHILPRCLCDKDPCKIKDKANVVFLTAREHFVCHMLLTRMVQSHKLKYAAVSFLTDKTGQRNINSFLFATLRKMQSAAISENNKGKTPWNKGRPWTDAEKKNISTSRIGSVPWNKGINPNKHIPVTKEEANAQQSVRMRTNNPMANPDNKQKIRDAVAGRSQSVCSVIVSDCLTQAILPGIHESVVLLRCSLDPHVMIFHRGRFYSILSL